MFEAVSDYSELARAMSLFEHWGFQPWAEDALAGVKRRVTFSKGGLLGEVARYYADDYIVWRHDGAADMDGVFRTRRPLPDVMLHRFVFVVDKVERPVRKRSFLLGLKGYIEVHQYAIGNAKSRRLRDLAPLIDQGWRNAHPDAGR
ncbi:MAG TPA: hypothetical protein PLO37_01580 [Candidatus Hydrogenedentes bacterium]|nr:hypothetical protein [Candidatus Hydrogenedentota bacterium]HPG65508.1 hypothetical protein [Candidatus Hydrogenedentota bacterium]